MLETTYNPKQIESHWYQFWEQGGFFQPSGSGSAYSIMIPPPNVTGTLHMGHAFQATLMDVLIRYQRMQGKNVLWQVGCDHAGIATQLLVERKLKAETGKQRKDFEREEFLRHVWDWKQHSHQIITGQMRRLGISVDWQRERFTMDADYATAVRQAFIQLHESGLIYQSESLVNWDPVLKTAVSDLEISAAAEPSKLYHVRYPFVEDSSSFMVIATTRPETILADGAVAVHPEDERYRHLVGKLVHVPNTERQIPIIADAYVKPEFGSGCVKITPAHDFNDYEVGKRHTMEVINLMNPDASLNASAPEKYRGLDRYEARERIVRDLEQQGLLAQVEEHSHNPPRGDRSGVVLEPYLTKQWFVKVESLAQAAGDAVRSEAIKFVPKQWENAYFSWVDNMRDWCISRQLWWGHRIPAFYAPDGSCYVADSVEDARARYGLAANIELRQDEDVLDTWFSSALWTFATLGWPQATPELKSYHPSSVLVTGFDIIFFWVARMIMMSEQLLDENPFHQVYIHGLVRDAHGQKMSKSKGNVLDPLDIIDGVELEQLVQKRTSNLIAGEAGKAKAIAAQTRKEYPDGLSAYGVDALRFSFCALASTGRDLNFDVQRIAGYRNFCNKLWNAARYVLLNCQDQASLGEEAVLSLADRWIVARLQQCIEQVHRFLQDYRFDWMAQAIYEFVWEDYCDWYLELSKPVLASEQREAAVAARQTLVSVLDTVLRLAHPIIPFISEEIWQKLAPLAGTGAEGDSLMVARYPSAQQELIDQRALDEISWLQKLVTALRTLRSENGIAPNAGLDAVLIGISSADQQRLERNRFWLNNLVRLRSLELCTEEQIAGRAVLAVPCHSGEAGIVVAGADLEAMRQRLQSSYAKNSQALAALQRKLDNPQFVAKAPEKIVAEQREKLQQLEGVNRTLAGQLKRLGATT